MTTTPESAQPVEQPKRRRSTRATSAPAEQTSPATADPEQAAEQTSPATADPEQAAEKPAAAPRKRAPRKPQAAAEDTTTTPTGPDQDDAAEPAPRQRTSRSRKPAADDTTESSKEQAAPARAPRKRPAQSGDAAGAPKRTSATRRRTAAATDARPTGVDTEAIDTAPTRTDGAGATDAEPAQGNTAQPAPTKRGTPRKGRTKSAAAQAEQPAPEQPADEQPQVEPQAAAEPADEQLAAEEPAAPELAAERSADEQPQVERPVAEQPAAQEPQQGVATPEDDAATPAQEQPTRGTSRGRGGTARTATTGQGDTPGEEAPAGKRGGTRDAHPARSQEQQVDVLAEFSAAEQSAEPTATEPVEAAEQDEDVEGVRLPATALLFQAPEPGRGRRRARAETGPPPERTAEPAPEPAPPADAATTDAATTDAAATTDDGSEDGSQAERSDGNGEDGQRRRRRRGGRGRRNRGGGREESEDAGDEEAAAPPATAPPSDAPRADAPADTAGDQGRDADEDAGEAGSSRRRRRRRGRSDDGSATSREGRAARDEITALKGSTRLEAKRQRRRDGRDAGRRRTTITEAEFLARRESVDRDMVVRERDGRTQIAVLEDGVLVEHYVAQETQSSMVGNVYLGRVQNVLPSMEAAFVDLGKGRNAVLYAGEVNWDAAGMGGQQRRIEQALSSGDSVLVQVTKDPIGHKGARLTAQVTLAGRYLVLVPSGAMTGISRKLPENERARLKKLLKEIVPEGSGVIVRTAAEGATEEQLRADVERLTTKWAEIQTKAKSTKSAPTLLKGEPELAVRVVRDVFNEDFRSLTVAGTGAWQTISGYVRELSPDLVDRMHHWTGSRDVFAEHRIDEQLAKGMDRKVYLPSGGSLVIDRTEAMTVIDINTGKFTGSGGTLEETVTRNNLEAAEEIVRQLRLRDIGGMIVIDFIDMVLESNRDLVLRRLVECLGRDRTRHQVAEVTSLGLVQMTRKRVGQGLVEAFSEQCEHCGGRGFVVHDHPVEKGSSGDGGDDGNRRRRQRGGNGGRPAEAPAPAPAEDPSASAAREAVKATLATIAAAAAQAHADDDAGPADSAAEAGLPTAIQTSAHPEETTTPAEGPTPPADAAPTEAADATSTGAAPAPGEEPTSGESVKAAEDVRASLDALAAALPAGREVASGDSPPATEAAGGAGPVPEEEAPVAGAAPAATEPDADDSAADPSDTAPEQAPQRPRRRHRRVTSGGPVTA